MAVKKIKGRKRHIVVDAMGNLLSVKVHAANIHDTKSGIVPAELALATYPEIKRFCGDSGYSGTFVDSMKQKFQLDVDIVKRNNSKNWEILPK